MYKKNKASVHFCGCVALERHLEMAQPTKKIVFLSNTLAYPLAEPCWQFWAQITSQEKEVTVKDKLTGKSQTIKVKIWNKTVANLSLMVLGSSAPGKDAAIGMRISQTKFWSKESVIDDLTCYEISFKRPNLLHKEGTTPVGQS